MQRYGLGDAMELGWLEDFLALVDSGNFNRAAQARRLTQPAFSRRIRGLEDWMGVALFDRSTHRVSLTAAGETFRPRAEEIVRRVLQSRDEARQIAGATASTLRFAATHVLSLTFFPHWLRSLERHDHVGGIQLISDTMQGCVQAMRHGQAHFLLCHHHPAVPGHLEEGQFRSVCVGHDILVPISVAGLDGQPKFLLPGSPEAALPLLSYNPQSALGWIVEAAIAASASVRASRRRSGPILPRFCWRWCATAAALPGCR